MKLLVSVFLIALSFSVSAQVSVSGKITDEQANPIPFATIYIKNTTQGTSANIEGEYSLQLKPGQYTVLYRAVGYKPETRQLDIKTATTANIKLITETYELQNITITSNGEDPAYGIIRKADLVGFPF